MSLLGYILVFSFLGSVASLVGGIILALRKEKFTHEQSLLMISFAAGVVLGTAFFDLLPEAMEALEGIGQGDQIWFWTLAGVMFLFLFEKSLLWYHHHDEEHEGREHTAVMITVGDTVHNFIDGMVMAGVFMVSIPAGIVTSLAVAAHEIPHEMADFGVLLTKGWSRWKTITVNVLSGGVAMVGALVVYFVGGAVEGALPKLLAFAGGSFVYLACSDLIPELHHSHGRDERKYGWREALVLVTGIVLVWGLIQLLEG